MSYSFFDRIKKDTHFRIKSFLSFSFIVNIAYAIFQFVISLVYSSRWFFVMSIYYALLSISRIVVFVQLNPNKDKRVKILTMRASGYFLLLINLVVSTMMFILTNGNNFVKHHEITVIALATYTFWSLSMAIVSSVKHIKQKNYLYSCAKIIALTSASVSLVTLTNTMLITFGESNLSLRSIVLPLLCGVVAVFIITSAIFMICKANLDLRIIKNEEK